MEPKPIYNVDNLPAGLDRSLLRILGFYKSRYQAVSKARLLHSLKEHGFPLTGNYAAQERKLRAVINKLRKEGHPICSSSGDTGYWIAGTWEELQEFIREIHSRAMDLLEQEKVLRETGEELWGKYSPEVQGRLF